MYSTVSQKISLGQLLTFSEGSEVSAEASAESVCTTQSYLEELSRITFSLHWCTVQFIFYNIISQEKLYCNELYSFCLSPCTDPLVSLQTILVIQTPGNCDHKSGNHLTKAVLVLILPNQKQRFYFIDFFSCCILIRSIYLDTISQVWSSGKEREESRGRVGVNIEIVIYFNLSAYWLQETAKQTVVYYVWC